MMQYVVLGLALLAVFGLIYWLFKHPGMFAGVRMPGMPAVSLEGFLYVVMALFGGVLLFRLGHYDWDLGQLWSVEPFWFYITGIVIVLFAIWKIGVGRVSTVFSAGSFWMQILTSFLVLSTFFFLLSKIFPGAPLFTTSEGYGHIALYYLLVGLIALVAANLKGKAWFVNTALVVLMFALTGHRTAELLDPSGKLFAFLRSSSGGAVVSATTAVCDGQPTTFLYDNPSVLYPVGDISCQKRGYVKEGCVWWLDAGRQRLAHTCGGNGMPNVDGISYLKPDPEAVVITNRCRAFAPGNLVEKCA